MSLVEQTRKLHGELRRKAGDLLLQWPVYDAWRYLQNAESRRLYAAEQGRMALSPVEQRVLDSLREDGIAMVPISDLLPDPTFRQIRQWAEELAARASVQERIREIEMGNRPDAKAGKFYLVRPLGDAPPFQLGERVIQAALSDPLLRIVCAYLGVFTRISAFDLWYSVATTGPEVLSQRWHRDPEDRALVKAFLYLRDCEAGNGPFCYVPGTHNAGRSRHQVGGYNYPEDGAVESQFPPASRKACTGPAGTLILCDTTGFHKGGHATTGSRYLFNTVYTTNACEPIARGWNPHCTLQGSAKELSPAARYAVGWLQSNPHTRRLGGRFA